MGQRGGAEHAVCMRRKQTIVVTAANDRKWEKPELGCLDAGQHMAWTLNQD